MGGGGPREWIRCDESGKEMVSRVLSERPFVIPVPPLHRVPLRLRNVVEISGPSNSAKSQVLVQAVVHFILPKEMGGIQFGGLEKKVVFFDLDCRFDVLRLSQILTQRITQTCGSIGEISFDELFCDCMDRFIYVRCYSSAEFLSSVKELCYHIQRNDDAVGTDLHVLLIDSVGAFHWIDRSNQLHGVCKGFRSVIHNEVSHTEKTYQHRAFKKQLCMSYTNSYHCSHFWCWLQKHLCFVLKLQMSFRGTPFPISVEEKISFSVNICLQYGSLSSLTGYNCTLQMSFYQTDLNPYPFMRQSGCNLQYI